MTNTHRPTIQGAELQNEIRSIGKYEPTLAEIQQLAAAVSAEITPLDGRDALAMHNESCFYIDLFKVATSVAAVLASFGKALSDPVFVSWATLLASLAQLRGLTSRVSSNAASICVLLLAAGKVEKLDTLQVKFIAERKRATGNDMGASEFLAAVDQLERLGCVQRKDQSLLLKQRVILKF
jgi:hypothetical protein